MDAADPFSSPTTSSPSCTTHAPPTSPVSLLPDDSSIFHRLSSNLRSLILPEPKDVFSDVLICVSGRAVPLHRSILAARSPFFMSLFSKDVQQLVSLAPDGNLYAETSKLQLDLARILGTSPGDVSHSCSVCLDAFMATVAFLYCGKTCVPEVKCMDDQCLHEACGAKVKFAVEMLHLSAIFDIPELKTYWEHDLQNMATKARVDDVVSILFIASLHGVVPLLTLTKEMVAKSDTENFDLQKQLPSELAGEIFEIRSKIGMVQTETINSTLEKECQRIRKALDSDDVELVQLLLKEGRVTLNEAFALHYATAYCDPRTVKDILELGLADVNIKNTRGLCVLHVAAMRRDPFILVALLSKGAYPFHTTPDGYTALQLCLRLTRRYDGWISIEDVQSQKECLSAEILYQAGMKNLFEDEALPPVDNERDLYNRLLYLENRVAVARLFFPQEVKLVTGISHLESTSEFTGSVLSGIPENSRSEATVDLNLAPVNIPVMNEGLLKRIAALQRTVVIGRKMFPRVTDVLNNFVEDDSLDVSMESTTGSPEEQIMKKQRYCELKEVLEEAFRKDVAAMERRKTSGKKLP